MRAPRVIGPEHPSPPESFAVTELNDVIQRLPDGGSAPVEIHVGTTTTTSGVVSNDPEKRQEGYSLEYDRKDGVVRIVGADEKGTLNGAMDFIHHHLRDVWSGKTDRIAVKSAPALELRGIWTWGSKMYNYEMFLDQMARWKLNLLVAWHMQVPKNAPAVADYAAKRGIKVVWGYSWGWPVGPAGTLDWNSPESIAGHQEIAVETFRREYAPLKPFGIYFQSNTESGSAIHQSDKLVRFVNETAGQLLREYPDLLFSAGLHYTSFAEHLGPVDQVDPRLNIMWEDLPGCPFSYDSGRTSAEGFDRAAVWTLDPKTIPIDRNINIVKKLMSLRGEKEDIGFVLKGFHNRCLGDDPQKIEDQTFLERKANQRALVWRKREAGWRRNLEYGLEVLRALVAGKARRKIVTLLVEDGLWEARAWYSVCLMAEALWDPSRNGDDLLHLLDACPEALRWRSLLRRPA
jgi:hypothetical protein